MARVFPRRAALFGLSWLVVYAALTALSQHSAVLSKFVANVVYLVPVAAAAGLSLLAWARTTGRARLTWRLLALANVLWLVGELIWFGYAYLTTDGAPTPSAADVPYLLSYCFALPAMVVGMGGIGPLRQARGLLDAVLVALSLGAVGWHLVIAPLVPASGDGATVVAFLYPVLDVIVVSVLVALGLSRREPVPMPVLLAGAGFVAAAVSDAGYTYLVVIRSYDDSSWLNLGWQVEAVLLSLAALSAMRWSGAGLAPRPDRDVVVLPAVVAALAITGLALADQLRDGRLAPGTTTTAVVLLAGLLARQLLTTRDRTRLAERLEVALREQERLAVTDGLTGLYNRRFFQEMLRLEAERAHRSGAPLSLLMVDLDDFKGINDRYGHLTGDAILVQTADRVRQALQSSHIVARYGGEEFVCLLAGADEEVAIEYGERVRGSISRTPVFASGVSVSLTGSVGVATVDGRADLETLVQAADRALYCAKARGRDRVVAASRLADLSLDTDPELPVALVWLADQIDAKLSDHEHSTAVSRWTMLTGQRLGLDPTSLRVAAAAGRLHDIGKINVHDAILAKNGPLTEEEWRQLRRHPEEGGRLITDLADRPDLARLVAAHHERYDGCGYPRGLAGEQIPIEARIIAVCDSWAAMLAQRPYAPAMTEAEARAQIWQGIGTQFDPLVARTFLALLDEGVIDQLAPIHRYSSV